MKKLVYKPIGLLAGALASALAGIAFQAGLAGTRE